MCKEKNHQRARRDLLAKDSLILLRVRHTGEVPQQAAAATVGLLNLSWRGSDQRFCWLKNYGIRRKAQGIRRKFPFIVLPCALCPVP
jgi:hypothetical protein